MIAGIGPPINTDERELMLTVTPSVINFKGAKGQKTGQTESERPCFLKKGLDSEHVLRALYSFVDADERKGSGIYQF
jgi:hypothetical protein